MVNTGALSGKLSAKGTLSGSIRGGNGGGSGTTNYEALTNKPSINTHTLIGDSNFEDIGLHFMTNVELQQLLGG